METIFDQFGQLPAKKLAFFFKTDVMRIFWVFKKQQFELKPVEI
jgi:hypothetical protein